MFHPPHPRLPEPVEGRDFQPNPAKGGGLHKFPPPSMRGSEGEGD
jgi:hypothetical protein